MFVHFLIRLRKAVSVHCCAGAARPFGAPGGGEIRGLGRRRHGGVAALVFHVHGRHAEVTGYADLQVSATRSPTHVCTVCKCAQSGVGQLLQLVEGFAA